MIIKDYDKLNSNFLMKEIIDDSQIFLIEQALNWVADSGSLNSTILEV